MNNILRPTLELTVIIPGMILAYLPVKSTLKISLPKLIAWLFPVIVPLGCIFRKNRALAPHERSAVPLGTDHCPVC